MKPRASHRFAAVAMLGVMASVSVAQAQTVQPLIGPSVSCGTGAQPFRLISTPGFVTGGTVGTCILCSVRGTENVRAPAPFGITGDRLGALLDTTVGLNSGVFLSVQDISTIYPPGRRAGFVIRSPDQTLLTLDLLRRTRLTTSKMGIVQETFVTNGPGLPLILDLAGGTNDTGLFFLSARTGREFDTVTINFGSLLRAFNTLEVLGACVSN